jgi:hypothetical protein
VALAPAPLRAGVGLTGLDASLSACQFLEVQLAGDVPQRLRRKRTLLTEACQRVALGAYQRLRTSMSMPPLGVFSLSGSSRAVTRVKRA